ncbi:helix-turn-helix domain-containing protein [soil metagenome]
MTDDATGDFGEQLRFAVGELVRATRAATFEASPGHIATLGFLAREGSMSIATLARRRHVRHQSQSATISELRQLGLVDRAADPNDGRGWLIALTAQGERSIAEWRGARAHWLAVAAQGLEPEERAVLDRIPTILLKLAGS